MEQVFSHKPVLLEQVLSGLNIKSDGIYIDATFGRGGHASAILRQLNENGRLLVMDRDPLAIATAQDMMADDPRVIIRRAAFSQMKSCVEEQGWQGRVDGILMDIGVSSPQLDDASRGFSFLNDGPLDMRMDTDSGISAQQWLKDVSESELARVLREYGEERFAKRIAAAIVKARGEQPITATRQLAKIIAEANPKWEKNKDPATRSFQAIRIFINDELGELRQCLSQVLPLLSSGGRLAIISFHSLEDRMVKRFFKEQARGDKYPAGLPVTQAQLNPLLRVIGKAIKATDDEVAANVRARSAVLRVAEKI